MTDDRILTARLRKAAEVIADAARIISAEWSVRVPASVHLGGGRRSVTIIAGGRPAPQAYTMEGRASGAPIAHPVYGRADRLRKTWTWVKQPPRPFLREAVDSTQDVWFRLFADIIDDWAHERGYK